MDSKNTAPAIQSQHSQIWVIFVLFFALYYMGTRFSLDGYELEYVLSAMNIYHGGGPQLAPGFSGCPGIPETVSAQPIYPRQGFLQSYMSVPFYALGAFLWGEDPTIPGKGFHWDIPWGPVMTVSMLNPLLSAGLVIIVALLALQFDIPYPDNRRLAVIFGLATMIWPYAGLGMEVIQTFFLMLIVLFAVCFQRSGRYRYLVLTAACMVLLPNCKKISFLFLLPIAGYVVMTLKNQLKYKKLIAIIVILTCCVAGITVLSGSLIMKIRSDPLFLKHLLAKFTETGPPIIDVVYGLILSPGEGLFVFNPILLFAIPGWLLFIRQHRMNALFFISLILFLLLALTRVPYLLIDEEWGPRYLHAAIPLLVIGGANGLLKVRKGFSRIFFIIILVISIAIQLLGSLFLGFKVSAASVDLGTADFTTITFTPSLSQAYVAARCFVSMLHRYYTGRSLNLEHDLYWHYSGFNPQVQSQVLSLQGYDQPVGALFTSRWVLAEMGYQVRSEQLMLALTLAIDCIIIFLLFYVSRSPARR